MKSRIIRLTAFLCLISLCQVSFAQVSLELENKIKPEPAFVMQKFSITKDALYTLSTTDQENKSSYFIEKYNPETLNLIYQKNLNLIEDDKLAMVHPLHTPPVCFEYKNKAIVLYCSYDENSKMVSINAKSIDENGNVNPKFFKILSSKDIDVIMEGLYQSTMAHYRPVFNYYQSEDKSSVIVEVASEKYKKVHVYKMEDLLSGNSAHQEIDLKKQIDTEKLTIQRFFSVNGNVFFSYVKKIDAKTCDFGMAVLDKSSNTFQLKGLGINTFGIYALDYLYLSVENKFMISGCKRYLPNPSKKAEIENSKVKLFDVFFDLGKMSFETPVEFDFLPEVAKIISTPETYGFIEKTHTPDQYIENFGLISSAKYYYSITHLVFGRDPGNAGFTTDSYHMQTGGGGFRESCRDILVSQYDKTGKLINQYLLPKNNFYVTVGMSRKANLVDFTNRQRNFSYILKNDDLHFFYLDFKKNAYVPLNVYDPKKIADCDVNKGSLIHMSITGGKISKEILIEKDNPCLFYSDQNIMYNGSTLLDLKTEDGKRATAIGRAKLKL